MRVFKVPFDTKREEKIFGGYLSLRQVTYLMLTLGSLSIFAIKLMIPVKLLLVIVIATFLLLCTFLRVNEQNFDKFFFYAFKYLFRKKKFVYRRCEQWE